MTNQIVIQKKFHEKRLSAFLFRGRLAFVAGQVGEALGYEQPYRFVSKFFTDWCDEFQDKVDYERIKVCELIEAFSGTVHACQELLLILPNASSITLLFESGIHLALLKTAQPIGVQISRWLLTEVMPQVAHSQALPERDITPSEAQSVRHDRPLPQHVEALDVLVETLDGSPAAQLAAVLRAEAVTGLIMDEIRLAVRGQLPPPARSKKSAQRQAEVEETMSRLLDRARQGTISGWFTVRELLRRGLSGLQSKSVLEKALTQLEEKGQAKKRRAVTGGRPRIEYLILPN